MALSCSSRKWENDLFLSFSGEDIRNGFLSHFHKELDRKPIHVFKDSDIKRGQSLGLKLKQAIRDSRIAVVIFSRKYASSSWCLNELLEIVKCKKECSQVVIPIFFRLDPTHAIITDVLGELALTQPKDSEDFVGIETHIAEMNILLHFESKEVRMVGICGPSGIGKTTIARVLFNRLSSRFRCNVFIDRAFLLKSMEHYSGANLDDYNMMLHLQGIFLSEILGTRDIKINHLGAVGEMLKNHKVLIFIDDLENQVVLDTLAGHTNWFGCGSRIVVITKHKHLLEAHRIGHIYEVPLPSDPLALQILCQYAFRQNYPHDGFMELVSDPALRACKLPLVLTILGSLLRGRDRKYWMDMLLRFGKVQHGKTEEILQFIYNELDNKNDEAIFRHIAFFNGEKVDNIKSLLADGDLDVNTGIKNLVDKSLIRETCNTVEMHSLIQEMGKEIVRKQSSEPGEREFLVDCKEICDVLKDNTGTENVLGISLDIDETDELHIHESAFKEMRNLRYLKISTATNLEALNLGYFSSLVELPSCVQALNKLEIWNLPSCENLTYLPSKLRLLSWDLYPLKSLPSAFSTQNLVEIDMKYSKLEKLWYGVQPLNSLKKMNLLGSKSLKEIPDLSTATNLEALNLGACSSLVKLPSSVQYLNKLKTLNLPFCENLETLPTSINLQALDCMNLSGCSRLWSFPDISTNITYLDLSQTGIEEVPWWIENVSKLRKLNMRNCKKLEYVSLNVSKFKHLEMVDFSNCGALKVASLNGSPITVAISDDIHSKLPVYVKVSSSIPDDHFPRVELNFLDCFNLDQEALLQQQSVFKWLILSGEEVPSYFTHCTTGTSMTNIPLLQTSLSQPFFRILACAVVDFEPISIDHTSFLIEVQCQFIDGLGTHFGSAYWPMYFSTVPMGSHLVIFNCSLPLNGDYTYLAKRHYDHMDIQFRLTDDYSQIKLKGCGIRLYED
ncbi:AAA+ ATPase domain [Arabidopsis suecica]|uniref:AAA+ ATPase domain n=1 Tax=Arabidopsis suecica TaxID=45249 RepID=A0A8T2DW20_ARASU|nr:AAA+ ATPase domain [Arabidopsis suecica]